MTVRQALVVSSVMLACACSAASDNADGIRRVRGAAGAAGSTQDPPKTTPNSTGAGGGPNLGVDLPRTGDNGNKPPPACNDDLDIVFVMDVSTSMDIMLDALADEILAVDAATKKLVLPSPPHYGLVVFVDDALFVNDGKAFADATALQAEFRKWREFTSSNRQVVATYTNTTFTENSIDALHLGATGFQWRPKESTLRMIIHTTDDTFAERPQNLDGIPIQHTYAEVVSALQTERIRLFAFASTEGGSSGVEDVGRGWFTDYDGSAALPNLTGGAVFKLHDVPDTISLSASIPQTVADNRCKPYPNPK